MPEREEVAELTRVPRDKRRSENALRWPINRSGRLLVSRPIVARLLSIAASFGLTAVVARQLGADSAGRFFVVYAVIVVVATVARFGTDNLALKRVAANPTAWTDVMFMFVICTAVSFAVSGILAAMAPVLLHFADGLAISVENAEVAILSVPPMAISVLAGAVLRGRGRVTSGTLAELGSTPAVAGLAIMAGAQFIHLTLGNVLTILVIANVFTAAWSFPLAVRCMARDGVKLGPNFNFYLRTNLYALSSMMGTSVLFYLITWTPLFALAAASTSRQVSYFAVSARLAAFIALIPMIQSSYLAPRFASLHATGRLVELNRLCVTSATRASLVATVPAILIIALPGHALAIFGSDFIAAAPVLQILCISSFMIVVAGQVNALMLTCGFERFAFILNLTVACATLVASLITARLAGALGVALVSALSVTTYAVVAAAALRLRGGIRSNMVLLPFGTIRREENSQR